MINVRALLNSGENEIRYKQNWQDEKAKQLSGNRAYKAALENNAVVKIDNYIFAIERNVEGLNLSLSVGVKKFETMKKNYYIAVGQNEQKISFNAKFFCENIAELKGFKDLVKKCEPLDFVMLQSSKKQKILIESFTENFSNFALDANREATFLVLDVSISGVVLES